MNVLDDLEDCDVLVADVTTLEDCLRQAPNLFDASLLKVVCVDEAGVVRGIVSLSDVFRLITGGREVPQPEPEPFA